MLPISVADHKPGFLVGWNSGTMACVCVCVVSDVALPLLERVLATLKERVRRSSLAAPSSSTANAAAIDELVDALGDAAETDEAACLLETISMRLVDALYFGVGDDGDASQRARARQRALHEQQFRRLADVCERTGYPNVLGTWGAVRDDDGAVAAKAQRSDFWISLRSTPSARRVRRSTASSLDLPPSASSSATSSTSSTVSATFASVEATTLCYGYSLVSATQVVLFDPPRGDQFLAQVAPPFIAFNLRDANRAQPVTPAKQTQSTPTPTAASTATAKADVTSLDLVFCTTFLSFVVMILANSICSA